MTIEEAKELVRWLFANREKHFSAVDCDFVEFFNVRGDKQPPAAALEMEGTLPEKLVKAAETDAGYYDLVLKGAVGTLYKGEELRPELNLWIAEWVRGHHPRPREFGPDPKKQMARNHLVCLAVAALVKEGVPATCYQHARDEKKARTACGIVAGVMNELGYKIQYEAVKGVWNGYKKGRNR